MCLALPGGAVYLQRAIDFGTLDKQTSLRVGDRLPGGPKAETTVLFHVTMTHTEDNCAIYHRGLMPGVLKSFENLEALGKELNVKLHYFTWCGPDHVAFVLLEADALSAIAGRSAMSES